MSPLALLLATLLSSHPARAASTEADLAGKRLGKFPPELLTRAELERLNLEDDALPSLPKGISALKRLRSLNLSKNRLKALPAEIGQLSSLEYLSVADNPLAALPDSIGQLSSLSILDLRGTPFARVPDQAIPLMRRGAAVLISSAAAAAYAEEPFKGFDLRHIQRETKLAYTVSIGLPRLPVRDKGKRADFFFPADGEIALFDPALAYGGINGPYPCAEDDRNPSRPEVASLPEKELLKFLKGACPQRLYAHGETGRDKVSLKSLRAVPLTCCGSPCARVMLPAPALDAKPLFFSTMPGKPGKESFQRLARLVDVPPRAKAAPLSLPTGFENPRTAYYRYAGPDGETFLAYVQADGIQADPADLPPTATWGSWQGVFWLGPNGAKLLTPPTPQAQRAYGASLEPVALYDVDGDGVPDLVLGQPVSLVLERYADGFRSWGFPAPLPNPCPEAPAH